MDWTDRPPTPEEDNDHETFDVSQRRGKDKPRVKLPPMTEPPLKIEKPDYVKNDASTSKLHEAIDAAERKLEEISAMIQKFHDAAEADEKDAANPQQQLRQQYKAVREEIRSVREARDRLRPQMDDIRRESRKLDEDEQLLKKSNLNLQVTGCPRVDTPEDCDAVVADLEERHQTTTLSSSEEKLLFSQIQKLKAAKLQLSKNMSEKWLPLQQRKAALRVRQQSVQSLYDEDNELKKQLDALLKKEELLQRLFDEQEEARGPIRELQSLRSSLQKTRNELEKQLRLMTIEHIRADKEYESYLRKMEFWERQEASKRQDERRAAFKERAGKSADRAKDRQAKETALAEGGTPRQQPSGRVTDAGSAPVPVVVAAQPNSSIYIQGLGPSVNKDNFLSIIPAAAKQNLASHRLVLNGIAFLEYDGVGPAKAALAVLRASKELQAAAGGAVVFEFAKSRPASKRGM